MATAAFTVENENFCRLVVLINEKGLEALRAALEYFSTQKHRVATFQDVLQEPTVKGKLATLKGPGRGKPISPYQWNILYPTSGTAVTVTGLDITLSFLLIRNITGLRQPKTSWDKPPAPTDNSLEGGLAQIKFLRNTFCHKDNPSLTPVEFKGFYDDIEKALLDIDRHLPSWYINKADIQKFRLLGVSLQQQQEVDDLVKKWYDQEKDLFADIEQVAKQTDESGKKIEQIAKQTDESGKKIEHVAKQTDESGKKIKQVAKQTDESGKKIEQIAKQTDESGKKIEQIAKQTDESGKRIEEIHKHLVPGPDKRTLIFPSYTPTLRESVFGQIWTKRKCIRYLRQYYMAKMGKIQRIPWEENDTFDLKDLYVNLCQIILDKKTDKKKKISLEHYWHLITTEKSVKVIIQGHAGMGKTTLVSKIAVDWANGLWKSLKWWKSYIPLVLKLRNLAYEDGLAEAIKTQLFNGLDISVQEVFEFITIYRSQIVLLLDGFDEFSRNSSPEVWGLIKQEWFQDISILVTTRPWRTKEIQDSWDKLIEIRGFEKKDVNAYVDNFFKTVPNGLTKSKYFKDEIEKEQYYPLLETPLVVLFNCLVFLDTGKIYSCLTEQYKAVIDCMKKRSKAKGYDFDEKSYEMIEDFALEGLLSGNKGLIFSAEELSQILGNDIFHLGFFTVVKLPDKGIKNQEFVFTHKTLQEYQAARSLVRKWKKGNKKQLEELEKHCQNPAGILEMGKLLQFCSSLDVELKKYVLPWFPKNLQFCSKQMLSSDKFTVLELTKDIADLCQAYNRCVSDHSKSTEELIKAKNQFLNIAEKHNYSILFDKENGKTLGIATGDRKRLLDSTKMLTNDSTITTSEQILVFQSNFFGHDEHETMDVIQYMTLCKNLKKIEISWCSSHNYSRHPLLFLFDTQTTLLELEELVIPNNRFSLEMIHKMTKYIKYLPNLKKLDVGSNNIGDKGAKMLGENFKFILNLEELILKNNDISLECCSELATHLKLVPKLKILDVGFNNIGDKGAKVLGENFQFILNLEELILTGNFISSEGCSQLAAHLKFVPKLKNLDVALNKIGDKGAKVFGENFQFILNLEKLILNNNDISSEGCSQFAKHLKFVPKLKKLDVGFNNIGVKGATILGENFEFIPNLEELNLNNNDISSQGCSELATHLKLVPKLKILDVGLNYIGDKGAKVLGENFQFILNLEELILTGNLISSEGCSQLAVHLKFVPKLKILDVGLNNIGDKGAKVLGENFQFILNLEELILTGNLISSKGFSQLEAHLKFVPKLKKLQVGWNKIVYKGVMLNNSDISSEGCSQLAVHLKLVPKLKKLDLG